MKNASSRAGAESGAAVACVSNISIGYGTPQIQYLVRSLCAHYGTKGMIIEVDQPERPRCPGLFADLELLRIHTAYHPYHRAFGRPEYLIKASEIINRVRPSVLVLPSSYCLPVLWKLKYRPGLVIYYMLETLVINKMEPKNVPGKWAHRMFHFEESAINRFARNYIDLALFPEEHRMNDYIEYFGYHGVPSVLVYNAAPTRVKPVVPVEERNGRILYQGGIIQNQTYAEYYLENDIQEIPIDLYGLIEGQNKDEISGRINGLAGNIRYKGYINSLELGSVREKYNFSIIIWNPDIDQQLYACPNKFFESISDGVPPITAPHPQTKMLVEKYNCGIVMEDWSFGSFKKALLKAKGILGTPEYARMVENCEKAARLELNWESQFEKLTGYFN